MLADNNQTFPHARKVALFRNGANQAVRIPREFELAATEAMIRREEERLIIEPLPSRRSLLETLETLDPLDETFPNVDASLMPAEEINFQ